MKRFYIETMAQFLLLAAIVAAFAGCNKGPDREELYRVLRDGDEKAAEILLTANPVYWLLSVYPRCLWKQTPGMKYRCARAATLHRIRADGNCGYAKIEIIEAADFRAVSVVYRRHNQKRNFRESELS